MSTADVLRRLYLRRIEKRSLGRPDSAVTLEGEWIDARPAEPDAEPDWGRCHLWTDEDWRHMDAIYGPYFE